MSAHTSPSANTHGATQMRKAITLPKLREMISKGEKIAMLTAYDASFARAADDAGLDCLLIGDSLGMVLQGHSSTLPVTMQDMVYHTRCVASSAKTAWIIGDLPYGSYHESKEQAYRNACALMQAGAHMVKLEGGGWTREVVEYLTQRSIPVCAHLGLTPQSVHALGGYRIQGKDDQSALKLKREALELESAGASLCVLELMPTDVAAAVTQACQHMGTIGIGAGNATSGQVLVLHDMLGITHGKVPRFVKNFLQGTDSIHQALSNYVAEVKAGSFPDVQLHGY